MRAGAAAQRTGRRRSRRSGGRRCRLRGEQWGEGTHEAGQGGHLVAGSGEGVDELVLVVFELVGVGQHVACQASG